MLIEELDPSTRLFYCLKRAGIHTAEQLSRMSDDDLLKIRGFGRACLAEVRNKISAPRMTNADRIRVMTDEELARVIYSVPCCDHHCEHSGEGECLDCIERWLKRPAEGSE